MHKSPVIQKAVFAIMAVIFVYAFWDYFDPDPFLGNSFFPCVLVVAAYLLQTIGGKCSLASKKYGWIYGVLMATAMIVGREFYRDDTIAGLFQSGLCLLWAVVRIFSVSLVIGRMVAIIYDKLIDQEQGGQLCPYFQKHHILLFFILWGIILLGWLPAYFAYYPGIANVYDFSTQAAQAYSGIHEYSKHHPPLHTWLLSLAIIYGESTGTLAVTIYGKVQMLFLSAVMARQIYCLLQEGAGKRVWIPALLYAVFNPVLAIFSLVPVKDAVFAGFFALLTIRIYQLAKDPQAFFGRRRNYIYLVLDTLLSCLLRKNMIYVVILLVPVLLTCMKGMRKKLGIILAGTIAVYFLINDGFYPWLGMIEGAPKEGICVPMQQVARTACLEEGLSDEDKEFVQLFLPFERMPEIYTSRNADPVKYLFSNDAYDQYRVEFWKGYVKLGLEHPMCYLDALLALNLAYWYPDAGIIDIYDGRLYIDTGVHDEGYELSKAPGLLEKYERVANFTAFDGKPFIAVLFSLSTPLWFMLLALFGRLTGREKKTVLAVGLGLLLWATYVMGPLSNFRYVFALVFLYPFYWFILVGNAGQKND